MVASGAWASMHRRRARLPLAIQLGSVLAAALAGCGSAPPTPSPPPALPAPAPTSPDPTADFESRQVQAAEAASRQGRWADAVWAWDVLLTLRPGHSGYTASRQQSQAQLESALTERLSRADAARRRGEIDAAASQYLGALALAPTHSGAADALRVLERERIQRQHLGKLSRLTLVRQPSPTRPPARVDSRAAAKPDPAAKSSGGDRNVVEHAAMLATQGEVGAAIALLQAHLSQRGQDAAAQKMLTDLLEQRLPDSPTRGLRAAPPASAARQNR
jgi:hypothetical protein